MVFVELPEVDDAISTGDDVAVAESVKAASDIYAPVSGTVIEVNEELEDSPELVNSDAFGEGWLFKVKLDDTAELDNLLDAEGYANSIDEA
jgi:glycine cleavage system H protein